MIKDIIFAFMRMKGTRYDSINRLPAHALPVSLFAKQHNISSAAYVHIKYNRYLEGKGANPGYSIRCYNGTNYVISEN